MDNTERKRDRRQLSEEAIAKRWRGKKGRGRQRYGLAIRRTKQGKKGLEEQEKA